MTNVIGPQTSSRLTISLSQYQRQQISELVERKVVSTVSQAVGLGLNLLIRQHKFQRWDDEIFTEYEAGMLQRNPRTGILLSRQFQKDLNKLVKELEPELRRGTLVILSKIVHHFDPKKFPNVVKNKSLEIKELKLKNYYFADFMFRNNSWRILLRLQKKDLIVCKIGRASSDLWIF